MTLNGDWKLYGYEHGKKHFTSPKQLNGSDILCINATVPGNVELDLSKAGLLPKDLFFGENILKAEQYEKYEWWYEKRFVPQKPAANQRVVLQFCGVDCYAEYFLNGDKIGDSQNMFIEHFFDITDSLNYDNENIISVHIFSTVAVLSKYTIEPYMGQRSWHHQNFSAYCRKAPHSFGWDIMPRALSAGLWRDVSLSYEEKYGFKYLYFYVTQIENENANITLLFDSCVPAQNTFERMRIEIKGECDDHSFSVSKEVSCKCGKIEFRIDDIKLWWPRYYGEPNLYKINVRAYSLDGELLFESTVNRGFRTIELDRTDTVEDGEGRFRFIVNGVPIFLFGSNWVCLDVYHSMDKFRRLKALNLAFDVGCNVLRCWGGNVYEDSEFFDFCDSHGIVVWQDFAMACQYYPQTEEFKQLIKDEAESVVKKFRQHPSLCIWCGDNEVDYMTASYGINPSLNRLTREVIAGVVDRLDPITPYIPSSPYISERAFSLGANSYPENHLWGPRDYFKSNYYTKSNARFVSEIGYHGCPSSDSIKRFIAPEFLWPYQNNRQWNLHSTDQDNSDARVLLMEKQIRSLFGIVPNDMEKFISASQASQAEAYKFFIERARADMTNMGGVIWWNLIDGWPQMSDAVVDYYYQKKAAYDFIKRSSLPFIILMGEDCGNECHKLICANNTLDEICGEVTVTDAKTQKTLYSGEFSSSPNQNTVISEITTSGQGMCFIDWKYDKNSGSNTYLYGKPPFDFEDYNRWILAFNEKRQVERAISSGN